MFIDETDVTFQAGDGGHGKNSFYFYKGYKRGPNGGDGGDGGNVYMTVISDHSALIQFMGNKVRKAERGYDGLKDKKSGKNGKYIIVVLPLGSILTDKGNGEIIELNDLNRKVLICKGGRGGRGTFSLLSQRNPGPVAEPGEPGQRKDFKIVLKLIVDYGL